MKITDNNPSVTMDAYLKSVQNSQRAKSSTGKGTNAQTGGDKVVLSPQAREINQAKQAFEACPDIRQEKVARLKEQIANGTYRLDAAAVSAKMIKESMLNKP